MRVAIPGLFLLLAGCNKAGEPATGEYERPANPTCFAPDRPQLGGDAKLERAFPNLSFDYIVGMEMAIEDDGWWYVLLQDGRLVRFENRDDVTQADVVLDIRGRVEFDRWEQGLLGLALHPDFADNGQIFVNYTASGPVTTVSRFTSADGGASFDASGEEVLLTLNQPFTNHNGGDLAFGHDGMLYIAVGDGGSAGDPRGNGQNTDTLLGSILRIDVDGAAPYAVPSTNPFANGGGAPEIYAWGMRNPWRIAFDPVTGELWAADVGQGEWEEIDRIQLGGNYGWNPKEGSHCYAVDPCDDPSFIDPVLEYDHNQGRSITGGVVYQGGDIPSLQGVYLYTDFYNTTIYGVFQGEDGAEQAEVAQGVDTVATFAQDNDGEVYVPAYRGAIQRLVADTGEPDGFPRLLSETGCRDPVDIALPSSGLVPYDVQVELWSDGAQKRRWMAMPDGAQAGIGDDGHVVFPVGTVLVKDFALDGQLLETRHLVRHQDGGWAGYTYVWNAEGTDAVEQPGGADLVVGQGRWPVPSRAQCMQCHTEPGGRSLGPDVGQLNGSIDYPGGLHANQLETLDHIGWFDESPGDPEALPSWDSDDARDILHVNCSHCHQAQGTTQTSLDLRRDVSLDAMGLCGVSPTYGDLGIDGALLVAPGEPDRSVLLARMGDAGDHRMPPIGTLVVDEQGVQRVRAWIEGMGGCE